MRPLSIYYNSVVFLRTLERTIHLINWATTYSIIKLSCIISYVIFIWSVWSHPRISTSDFVFKGFTISMTLLYDSTFI